MCTAGSEADGMAQQAYMTETADGGSGPERPGSRLRRLLHRMLAHVATLDAAAAPEPAA